MVDQPAGKPGRGDAIGVEEGDQRRLGGVQAGVARGGRTPVRVVANVAGAGLLGDGDDRLRHRGAVVDDDHGRAARQRRQARAQPFGVGVHRHDDRHLVDGLGRPRRRVGPHQSGVEQATGEQSLGLILADRLAGQPGVNEGGGARGQSQGAERRAAEQDLAGPENLDTGGEAQTPAGGDGVCHQAVRPPSTGTTVPVTAEASGPQSHTTAAATSLGSSSRLTSCWPANAS